MVRAVKADKADRAQVKRNTMTKSSNHSCSVVASDKASKERDCVSKDRTMNASDHDNSFSSKGVASLAVGVSGVRCNEKNVAAVIHQHLMMSVDVELNPGPLDGKC